MTTTPAQDPADYRGYIDALKALYAPNSPENNIGRGYREFTEADYGRLRDRDIQALRLMTAIGRPEVWEFMPDSLRVGRTEGEARFLYQNLLLREAGRRNLLGNMYEDVLRDNLADAYNIPPGRIDLNTPVTVVRRPMTITNANGQSEMSEVAVPLQPEDFYVTDLAMDVINNRSIPGQRGVSQFRPDLAQALAGINGQDHGITFSVTLDDKKIYDAGFTLGADPDIALALPVEAFISPEVYARLPQLGAAIGSGRDVDDQQVLTAGFVAGRIASGSRYSLPSDQVFPSPPPQSSAPREGVTRQ